MTSRLTDKRIPNPVIRYMPGPNEIDVRSVLGRRVYWIGRGRVIPSGEGTAIDWDFMDTDNMLSRERVHVRMDDGSVRKICLNFDCVRLFVERAA